MIKFATNAETWQCERVFKEIMSERNMKGPQGQQELYDFKDDEIKNAVAKLVRELKNQNISPEGIKFWL